MTRTEDIRLPQAARVTIVAGSGRLPVEVAESLCQSGHDPFVVIMEGEVEPDSTLFRHRHHVLALEKTGNLLSILKRSGATHVVLAGGMARRPRLSRMRPSLALLRVASRVVPALLRGGDDALLRSVVSLIEESGMKVVGAHQVVPDMLAGVGTLTQAAPSMNDRRDLAAAMAAARAIGSLDIGQAAVSIGGRVVALEGIEGTDGLLARVRDLRGHGRLAGRKGGVLAKCAKPGQELRADLPTIGPDTVEAAHAAGLAGIGVEALRSLIVDHGRVRERADALGLFVVGLPAVSDP